MLMLWYGETRGKRHNKLIRGGSSWKNDEEGGPDNLSIVVELMFSFAFFLIRVPAFQNRYHSNRHLFALFSSI